MQRGAMKQPTENSFIAPLFVVISKFVDQSRNYILQYVANNEAISIKIPFNIIDVSLQPFF
jgi:hypothetical protein